MLSIVNRFKGLITKPHKHRKETCKMATTQEMLDDTRLAQNIITNSDLSKEYKRTYLKLLDLSTMATNGISPEEKIQKMTEAIHLLAITQGLYMAEMDNKINTSIKAANEKQCQNCRALKHADDIESKKKEEEKFRGYIKAMGLDPDNLTDQKDDRDEKKNMSWEEVCKTVLTKPYIYVVIALMTLSPFGVEIVKAISQMFGK